MKNNEKGITMVEVMVSMLIASIVMTSGIAFFLRAFASNYRISDFVLAQDKSSSMVEEMQLFAISTDDNTPSQSYSANEQVLDWRIERIENGWVVHISAIADRIEFISGITTQTPALIQLFCFSMWPVSETVAFGIYSGGYQNMWNLDVGGLGSNNTFSCMTRFNDLNTSNQMTAIRLKTAYARFAYETR
ncbi:MAG: prepilin-type N-terminal cleavage/methylation domain-containing protein [Endomicrobium sp.]|jgi:type II secretory pathway pseudopilin PulG|nr:prepilin-type N-terminal cleavage/methylation domain-containing protein [Endomicrobium sp.]